MSSLHVDSSRSTGVLLAVGLALLAVPMSSPGSDIERSRHNLSVSGPGPVKSTSEQEICIFCHASHVESGEAPLWNRWTSDATDYQPYESSTMTARPGTPDGTSRLCLSCHDGTIAVGAVRNLDEPISMIGVGPSGRLAKESGGNLSTDLSGTHPISVPYASATARGRDGQAETWLMEQPRRVRGQDLLDAGGRVQCTSCHDPHRDRSTEGVDVPPFWRGDRFDEVCEACHVAPTQATAHDDGSDLPEGCGSCHVGHGVSGQPLLPWGEEKSCYTCHGDADRVDESRDQGLLGRAARPVRIDDLFERASRHPVEQTWLEHDPTEDLLAQGAGIRRHVECADCHPTHGHGRTEAIGSTALPGSRVPKDFSDEPEYETCYGCHSTNPNLPFGQTDKSAEFDPVNGSYHPIEAAAVGVGSESLLPPWLSGDLMTCSDCHGADGDDERRGPHGSRNDWILRWPYMASDGLAESPQAYEACYACHSRTTVLGDGTWAGHGQHVSSGKISCYTCHDSHGSPEYPGLVRFNKDPRIGVVDPSSSGRLEYQPGAGACYLSCHGVDHDPLVYP